MKDKLASYNHLIETFVIVTETFLCGLLFLLFSKLSNEMQWDSLQVGGTTVLQVMLTLMLCYALCAIHSGIVLHRRKVHSRYGNVCLRICSCLSSWAVWSFL